MDDEAIVETAQRLALRRWYVTATDVAEWAEEPVERVRHVLVAACRDGLLTLQAVAPDGRTFGLGESLPADLGPSALTMRFVLPQDHPDA